MSTASVNIRVDAGLKTSAQSVLTELGLDMSTAIKAFLKQVVYRQAIPFEISKQTAKRVKLGGWEGRVSMTDDFNEPNI